MTSAETPPVAEPFKLGGGVIFGIEIDTVPVGSTVVVETENDGGGEVVGGGVVAGGGVGVGVGCAGAGSGVGADALGVEVEVEVVDDGAGVEDVVPLAGGCVVVVEVGVVAPVAGVVDEDVEPVGFDEVFGAAFGAVALLSARAGPTGTVAAVARLAAWARWRVAFAGAGVLAAACGCACAATGCAFGRSTAGRGAERVCLWPTAGSSFAIATVRSTAAVASR